MRDKRTRIQEMGFKRQKIKNTGNGVQETKEQRYREWGKRQKDKEQ